MYKISIILNLLFLLTACTGIKKGQIIYNSHYIEVSGEKPDLEILDLNMDSILKDIPDPVENKPWLGIYMKSVGDITKYGGESGDAGVMIDYVISDTPAERYGIKNDDIIISFGGKTIPRDSKNMIGSLKEIIKIFRPGDTVSIKLLRDNEIKEIQVVLDKKPVMDIQLSEHPEILEQEESVSANKKNSLQNIIGQYKLGTAIGTVLKKIKSETRVINSFKVYEEDFAPFRLKEVNYLLNYPMDLPIVSEKIIGRLSKSVEDNNYALLVESSAGLLDEKTAVSGNIPSIEDTISLDTLVDLFVTAIKEAATLTDEAFKELSKEEINYIKEFAPKIYDDKTELPEKDQKKLFNIALKVNYTYLFTAMANILKFTDSNYTKINKIIKGSGKNLSEDYILVKNTDIGKVIIGGLNSNTYNEDAALIIDVGGNDRYFNNSGSSTESLPFSIVIDLEGEDIYAPSADLISQGAGFLGNGLLIDISGNDYYLSSQFSQGFGLFGTGILIDMDGNDNYSSTYGAQGVGGFGLGILIDKSGHDKYTSFGYSQGMSITKGFGLVLDEDGNDMYYATGNYTDHRAPNRSYQSFSQGFSIGLRPYKTSVGASGGIGILADLKGNDTYIADYFSQGSSYWFSLGILADKDGFDKYYAGRYSQGAGIHNSVGLLEDYNGDDIYMAYYGVSQGCGHDAGVGILVDKDGNDYYKSGILAQGAGNSNGMGILYDLGGIDKYEGGKKSQGAYRYTADGDEDTISILIDGGGKGDSYSLGQKNGNVVIGGKSNISIDF